MHLLSIDSIEKETYGGMEEWIRLVSTGLANRGHTVTVAGRPNSEFLRRVRQDKHVNILEVEFGGDFNPATIARLSSYIHQQDVDVVTVNFNKDLRLGGLAAKMQGGVRVVWSVGLDITSGGMAHRVLTPKLLDSVIVPSEALKRQICAKGYIDPEMVEIIPIGIDDIAPLERSKARAALNDRFGLADEHIVAVTSGRFVEQKGHTYLVDALAKLKDSHPMLRLLWLGDGPLRAELTSRIEDSGLVDRIIMPGMQDNTDHILAACDLMLHSSIEEPFGIVLTEGMRAGLAIVATDVGGIPEVVSEHKSALLVPPRDPDALATAAARLIDDPALRKRLGDEGHQRFQKLFTLEKMIDRVELHLNRVLATGRPYGSTQTN